VIMMWQNSFGIF